MTIIERLRKYSQGNSTEHIGLIMQQDSVTEWYECTPKNCLTFASTGGDGVHFSILEGYELDHSPVIITVPMNFDSPNMVIAENIQEFLNLGCRYGYFALEQLCYDFESTVQNIAEENVLDPEDQDLVFLSKEFGLLPLQKVGNRIEELNATYAALLQVEAR